MSVARVFLDTNVALEGNCKRLYSEDLQPGRRFGDLVVENPFAAIQGA